VTKPKAKRALAVVPPMTDAQAFLAMIDRAARDPHVDIGKMRELLAMRNDEQQRLAKQAFSIAMVECQDGMRPIKKNMQADRFRYASLEALDDALRGIYSKAGFALSYNSAPIEGSLNRLLISCTVMHRGGHEQVYSVPITVSTKGPKGSEEMTQTQGEGAAVSFGRRYLLLMIFNIITSENDAAITMNGGPISDEQLWALGELIKKTNTNVADFCGYMQVDALVNLPVSKFTDAKAALEAKERKQKEATK
jgi:hypothetical protein